jgi:ferredoxin
MCCTADVTLRIKVDYDECEANAVCVGIAPEVFDVDDDDNLWVLQEEPGPELEERVRSAVAACPKRALTLVEAPPESAG